VSISLRYHKLSSAGDRLFMMITFLCSTIPTAKGCAVIPYFSFLLDQKSYLDLRNLLLKICQDWNVLGKILSFFKLTFPRINTSVKYS